MVVVGTTRDDYLAEDDQRCHAQGHTKSEDIVAHLDRNERAEHDDVQHDGDGRDHRLGLDAGGRWRITPQWMAISMAR